VGRARRWHGLRQDSGDPFGFAPLAKEVCERLGINPSEKTIVYSDWLNVDKTLALKKQCEEIGFNRGAFFFFIIISPFLAFLIRRAPACFGQRLSALARFSRMTSSRCQAMARRRVKRST